jgi:hypothetical protein
MGGLSQIHVESLNRTTLGSKNSTKLNSLNNSKETAHSNSYNLSRNISNEAFKRGEIKTNIQGTHSSEIRSSNE